MPRTSTEPSFITTDIPARLERFRWGHFHSLVVIALGITWALDGLEVTLAGAVAGALKDSPSLALSNAQLGWRPVSISLVRCSAPSSLAGSPTG